MLTLTQQVQIILQKTFSGFFMAFLKSTWNGEHFQKKGESSSLSISEIIDSKRGGYLRCLKSLTSEQLSVINLLTGSKHCLNLHGTTINLFFHESGINWAGKSLEKCLLTRWLPSTRILVNIRSKILGLFVNTLTAEYMYSGRNMQTFTQQVQTPLSSK